MQSLKKLSQSARFFFEFPPRYIERILTQASTGQSVVNCKLVDLLPPKTDMFSNGLHSFAGLPVCSQQVSFIC